MAERTLGVLQGTLDMLVLRTLAWEPMHGYGITQWIRQRTEGRLEVQDAALYQSLRRLEARGLIKSTWRVSENNRRARYYSLTPGGRARMGREEAEWKEYAAAVFKVLGTGAADGAG